MNINGFKDKFLKTLRTPKLWIKEKINFLDQFSSLINSWIPITSAIQIINYQTKNKRLKTILKSFSEELNSWDNLREVFSKFPTTFEFFDLSIIEMGELTWKIWDSIDVIKNKEEKNREIKSKILWALMYPMIIISLSLVMIITFITYVIPKITEMYKDARVNLPSLTQRVINLSDFLQKNIFYIVIWIISFLVLFWYFKKNKKTKIYFDNATLHVPIFWTLIKKKILAMFTFSLWTLLKNWVIINKSLEISAWTVDNDCYKIEIKKILNWISSWEDFSKMLWIDNIKDWIENPFFPIELASAVKIWEQTGRLSELLLKFSIKYNRDIDDTVKILATAIEPLVIVFVWIIIWTLIMAVLLPFFNMVNVM